MTKARVTLQTIADRLGVSRTTVSNAFSKPDQLSDALRERILATAAELGYVGPDPAARTLRRGRAGTIGLMLTESLTYAFGDPYAMEILSGVAEATEPEGLALLLIPVPPGLDQRQAVARAVVDAFCIYAMPEHSPAVATAVQRALPLVCVDGPVLDDHPYVGSDDHAAALAVGRHVAARGHRCWGVVTYRLLSDGHTGLIDDARIARTTFESTRQRLTGILRAAGEVGMARADVQIYEGVNRPALGRRAAAAMLDGPKPPTAILCLSDELAAGVVEEVGERGLRVPDDVAVTGWDDTRRAEALDLTTVHQRPREKGRLAARWLLDGTTGARRELLDTELVVRGSTGGGRP